MSHFFQILVDPVGFRHIFEPKQKGPEAPLPVPASPTASSAAVQAAGQDYLMRQSATYGQAQTVATSGTGAAGSATLGTKTLLGQ